MQVMFGYRGEQISPEYNAYLGQATRSGGVDHTVTKQFANRVLATCSVDRACDTSCVL